jgi:hypothetical protein
MGTSVEVDGVAGTLATTFLVEPFVPHPQEDEYTYAHNSMRTGEVLLLWCLWQGQIHRAPGLHRQAGGTGLRNASGICTRMARWSCWHKAERQRDLHK